MINLASLMWIPIDGLVVFFCVIILLCDGPNVLLFIVCEAMDLYCNDVCDFMSPTIVMNHSFKTKIYSCLFLCI